MPNITTPAEFTDSANSTPEAPPSDNRLLANRANALLSTGPRTPDGNSRSAQNAFRHGLRTRLDPAALVPATEQSDYADFLADIRDHLDPQSSLDDLLVERIALLGWKLRRHAQAEAHLLDLANQRELDRVQALNRAAQEQHDQQLAHNQRYRIKTPLSPPNLQPLPSPEPAAHLLARFSHSEPSANPLATLQRYESTTERAFYKALIQYRILRTASSTTSTGVADLHHHFHYHRHNAATANQPPSPRQSVPNFQTKPTRVCQFRPAYQANTRSGLHHPHKFLPRPPCGIVIRHFSRRPPDDAYPCSNPPPAAPLPLLRRLCRRHRLGKANHGRSGRAPAR